MLEELFARVLRVPKTRISDETTPETLPHWDSLKHLSLVTAIETEYGVKFSTGEIIQMQSVGEARRLLREKGCTTV
jgi:acyl carrier protein